MNQFFSTLLVSVVDGIFSGTVVVTLDSLEVVGCEVWAVVIASVVVSSAEIMVDTMTQN
jgi:hypothetical protein